MKLSISPSLYGGFEKKKRKTAFFFKWGICLPVGFLLFGMLWVGFYAISPAPLAKKESAIVLIPPKTSFQGIQDILIAEGIIRADGRFGLLARVLRVSQQLKAGEYLFEASQTPLQVLSILKKGSVFSRPVTITEGANIYQVADTMDKGGWVGRERFLELVQDPLFIQELDLNVNSLEGYLFPDTYYFSRGQNERDVIRKTVNRLKEVFDEVVKSTGGAPDLSRHELLTLASIVEKETAISTERPLIAGVFLNRLKKGMRLQADPTVIYGLTKFDGNLTRRDLKSPSPYNTYVIKGLPPGPIGNPGRAAIEAVVNPAKGAYLYFVSKNDGAHHFSKTLAEHNRAVVRYQKRKNRR